jgi:hypothetical protein
VNQSLARYGCYVLSMDVMLWASIIDAIDLSAVLTWKATIHRKCLSVIQTGTAEVAQAQRLTITLAEHDAMGPWPNGLAGLEAAYTRGEEKMPYAFDVDEHVEVRNDSDCMSLLCFIQMILASRCLGMMTSFLQFGVSG